MGKTHSALTDAIMAAEILVALLRLGNLTIEQAYQLLEGNTDKPEDIGICPFKKHLGKPWKQVIAEDKEYVLWLTSSGKIRNTEMDKFVKNLIKGVGC